MKLIDVYVADTRRTSFRRVRLAAVADLTSERLLPRESTRVPYSLGEE